MIKVLYGEETYCVWFKKHKYIDSIENKDFNVAEFDEFSQDTLEFLRTYPMLSDRKACLVNVADLKDVDNKYFNEYLANPEDDTDLIILPQKVDARLKIFKALQKADMIEEHKRLATNDDVKKMVAFFLKPYGAQIREDACVELLNRLNYTDKKSTMTLWTVKQVVENLAQTSKEIDKALVEQLVEKSESENVFALIKLILNKDIAGIARQEDIIMRTQGTSIGALAAILREYRMGYKKAFLGITPKDIGVNFVTLSNEPAAYLLDGVRILTGTIADIKQGRLKPDRAISLACEKLIAKGGAIV